MKKLRSLFCDGVILSNIGLAFISFLKIITTGGAVENYTIIVTSIACAMLVSMYHGLLVSKDEISELANKSIEMSRTLTNFNKDFFDVYARTGKDLDRITHKISKDKKVNIEKINKELLKITKEASTNVEEIIKKMGKVEF